MSRNSQKRLNSQTKFELPDKRGFELKTREEKVIKKLMPAPPGQSPLINQA